MTDWQTIDSAPRDGTIILLWDDKRRDMAAGFWGLHHDVRPTVADHDFPWEVLDTSGNNAWQITKATHWAPFPENPAL